LIMRDARIENFRLEYDFADVADSVCCLSVRFGDCSLM
jgi:hypothetical protein